MKKHINIYLIIIVAIAVFSTSAWCQTAGGIMVDTDLAPLLINEISGERALDYVTKISRFHRIRGGNARKPLCLFSRPCLLPCGGNGEICQKL